jgi:hypothetical protein
MMPTRLRAVVSTVRELMRWRVRKSQWRSARSNSMTPNPYADWTTEALQDYEEYLYNLEFYGQADTWPERDQILWELNRRGFGHLVPS